MIKPLSFVVVLMMLSNIAFAATIKNGVTHLDQEEFLKKSTETNTVVIDVRTEREYANGHIAGAINIPHANILEDISLLNQYKNKDIIFYCHSGVRARWVTNYLNKADFGDEKTLYHLKGDIRAWRARGRALVQ